MRFADVYAKQKWSTHVENRPPGVYNIVSQKWIYSWKQYISGTADPPGPIENSVLLTPEADPQEGDTEGQMLWYEPGTDQVMYLVSRRDWQGLRDRYESSVCPNFW